MNKKTIIVAGLALAISATAALAQPPAGPPGGGPNGGFRGGPPGQGGPGWGGGQGWGGHRMGRGMHRPYATPEELAKRQADAFARMDTNKDGKVTFEEFRADMERRKLERQHEMFKRFTGGADSVTLDQLKAREAQREAGRGGRGPRGPRGPGGPGGRGPDQGAPPAR